MHLGISWIHDPVVITIHCATGGACTTFIAMEIFLTLMWNDGYTSTLMGTFDFTLMDFLLIWLLVTMVVTVIYLVNLGIYMFIISAWNWRN